MKNSRHRKIFTPQRNKVRGNGNKCMMRRYGPHDKIKEEENGQSCSMYGVGKKYIQGFKRKT
jgi:hypothetical protein